MGSSMRSAEIRVVINLTKDTSYKIRNNNLEQEWAQFNKKLEETPKTTDA